MIAMATIAVVWISSISPAATASESRPAGETYVLIVSGIGKDAGDRSARERVANDLRVYMQEKASVKPDRLVVLAAEDSTAERIKTTIHAFALAAGVADRFVFYYIGQANPVAGSLRFNLPGPDITQDDLATWLAGIQASTQLVVLDCPCAAAAAKALARPGRVAIFAATQEQACAPRFGLHFVPALAKPESDANQDGSVSVLEAFTAAAREIEKWYRQMQLLPTETPGLDDNGDGRPGERPWRHEQDGGDGRLAAGLSLTPGVRI